MEEEEARGGREGGWAPGERGRDEEERETVRLLREGYNPVDAPLSHPDIIIIILFILGLRPVSLHFRLLELRTIPAPRHFCLPVK
jgi:hypothetical protein